MNSGLTSFCPGLSALLLGFSCGPQSLSNGAIPCKVREGFQGRRWPPTSLPLTFGRPPSFKYLLHSYLRFLFKVHIFHHATLLLNNIRTHRVNTSEAKPRSQVLPLGQGRNTLWCQEPKPWYLVRWGIRQRAAWATVATSYCGFLLWESPPALGKLQLQDE